MKLAHIKEKVGELPRMCSCFAFTALIMVLFLYQECYFVLHLRKMLYDSSFTMAGYHWYLYMPFFLFSSHLLLVEDYLQNFIFVIEGIFVIVLCLEDHHHHGHRTTYCV
jgi:hypothetical protein